MWSDIFQTEKQGYYGQFGGMFIPEILRATFEELIEVFESARNDPSFWTEYVQTMQSYSCRPTPITYLPNLSKQNGGAQIYCKREDLNQTGAHKANNVMGQGLLVKRMGKSRVIAETGAGQHGVATATVCALMGLKCIVYMGATDVKRQAPNVARMKMLGADVIPVTSGSSTLKDATNEAMRDWINNPIDTHYIVGSVVGPHPFPDMVARFQSVISKEIKEQLLLVEGRNYPDYLIACVGGGSNAAGTFYDYLDDERVKIICVEASGKGVNSGKSAATTKLGKTGIIHGSKTLLMQTDDGQITEPYSISAGLDYPGIGPMHANLFTSGRGEFISIDDDEAMSAGLQLSQLEGIIPAIETSHALAVFDHKKFNSTDIIVLNLSGRGDKDLENYINYFNI